MVRLTQCVACFLVTFAALFAVGQEELGDDQPAKLQSKNERTAADADRVLAAANFAHGRMLLQKRDMAGALRRFQRAWRLNPQALATLHEIVPLSFELKHSEEAARYAVLTAERDPKDAAMLLRLSAHLFEMKEVDRAAKLYEQALALKQKIPEDLGITLLHLEVGRHYLEAEKLDAAATCFLRVRDIVNSAGGNAIADQVAKAINEKGSAIHIMVADGLLRSGKIDEAAAQFQQANQKLKQDDLQQFYLARIDAARGDQDAALEKLQRYFEANLSEAGTEPCELLGTVLRKKLQDETAADQELQTRLEKLREQFPGNVPVTFSLASRYRSVGKLEQAEALYRELLKRGVALDVLQGLVDVAIRSSSDEKLLAALGEAVVAAGSLDSFGEAVEKLVKDKERLERLVALARTMHQSQPEKLPPGSALAMALLAVETKDFDTAEAFFEIAQSKTPPSREQVLFTWGITMFTSAQSERAAKVFERLIQEKVKPERNSTFYYYLAGAWALADKTDAATDAINKALELDPKSLRLRTRAAWILYHGKQHELAEQAYRQLLTDFDSDHATPEARDAAREARLSLSNICVVTKRLPEAEEWLEQVLDEFPEDVGAANDLGYLWADQNKNLERALRMCRYAVERQPDNKAYRDSLGWALFRIGKFDEALRELQLAVDTEEPDGVIFDHLADVFDKLGQRDKAVDAWNKAAESFRKEHDADKLRQVEKKLHPAH